MRNRGWQGLKDWQLMQKIIGEDLTLVAHNSRDFRGEVNSSGKGLHAREPLHGGLICLNAFLPMDIDRQTKLLRLALEELSTLDDLVNQALEITEYEDGSIDINRYAIP